MNYTLYIPGEFFILRQSYNSKIVHYMKKKFQIEVNLYQGETKLHYCLWT